MPVVFRYKGIRFFFYSNEGNPREPLHIHAASPTGEAKVWLKPDIRIASSAGFDRRTLTEILHVVTQNQANIERAWHEHFSG